MESPSRLFALGFALALVGAAFSGCRSSARRNAQPAPPAAPAGGVVSAPANPGGGGSARLASDGGCAPPPIASPAPSGTNLDELMAVVEGESITRRSLVHEIGERRPDQEEREYEEHLQAALLRRAINRIFVKAGEREGLLLTPDMIDEQVKEDIRSELDSVREQAEKIEKGSGAKITFERLLKDKGLTMEEYRSERAKDMMKSRYIHVLVRGVPGRRAVVDLEPSPEDIRRLYNSHRPDFDVRAAVRYAVWELQPFDSPDAVTLPYDEVMARTRKQAEALLVDFRRDRDAERVAKAYGIKDKHWMLVPAGQYKEAGPMPKELSSWLFAPNRRAGDSTVLEPKGEIVALALVETRAAKTLSFDDVQDKIIQEIKNIRFVRFREQHTLELLAKAQIWPSSVANDLVDQSRAFLARLDEDPVAKDIRLR